MYKYKFSIFTPCYNSSRFIHRVFHTLDSQTYRNFEWIVINDASTDNTSELIRNYIRNVDFNVKFFDLEKNQMIAANYNLAVSVAEGEIFFPYGHDDEFIPTVLEEYVDLLDKYDSDEIAGIVARCQTQYGKIPSPVFEKSVMNYWEYGHKEGHYVGEMPDCIKTDVLKKYFPCDVEKSLLTLPVERLIGCDGYKSICYNKVVRTYYVSENETALSKITNRFIGSSRYLYSLELNKFLKFYSGRIFWNRLRLIILYNRATILSKYKFGLSLKELNYFQNRFLFILLYPIVLFGTLLEKCTNIKNVFKKILLNNYL